MLSTRISKTKTALASLVAALASGQAGANATVLTFDGSFGRRIGSCRIRTAPMSSATPVRSSTVGCDITPDVVVNYVGTVDGRAQVRRPAELHLRRSPVQRDAAFLTVVWRTPPGNTVGLHSFDVAAELGETLRIDWIRVYRDGQLAYNNIEPLIPGDAANPSRLSIMFNPPIVGTVVQIELNLTRLLLKSERIGIDNIKFSQTSIPTPGAALLFAAGLGVFAARRR